LALAVGLAGQVVVLTSEKEPRTLYKERERCAARQNLRPFEKPRRSGHPEVQNRIKGLATRHIQTYYRWWKEYGGLKLDQAKRRKDLERENSKLKRLVAELSLEKQFLKDVAEGNF
jgi:hypothetical protein